MSRCWSVCRRESLRSSRSGLWFLGCVLFYEVYALYFNLILSNMTGAQPQPLSPLRWFMGGDLLVLSCFLLPVLLVKAFAEERQQQTYEQLLCTGLSPWQLGLGKYLSLVLQWSTWVLTVAPLLVLLVVYGRSTASQAAVALLGLWMVGCHWLAFGLWVSNGSRTVIGAFSKLAVALLLYWSLPFVKLIWSDPFYRVLWDAFDFRAILDRCAQGRLLLSDLIMVWGGSMFWLVCALARLDMEGRRRWSLLKNAGYQVFVVIVVGLIVYTGVFIAHKRPQQWDVTLSENAVLSPEYREIAERFPSELEVTVVLPKRLSIETYTTGRHLILSFLEKTQVLAPEMSLKLLDPDVDLLEMERLQQEGIASKSKIGFVHLRYGERGIMLSYHQWVSLGVMTLDNEPVHYLRQFHGEALMVRAVNALQRMDHRVRAVALTGFGELDLKDTGRLGGSAFVELCQQLGLDLEWVRPGVDPVVLEGAQLLMVLDPRQKPSEAYLEVLNEARERKIPTLALNSALGHHDASDEGESLWSPYGLEPSSHVVYQSQFKQFDAYTLPIHEHSNHEMMKPLEGQLMIMDRCRVIQEGIPEDPRWVTKPLLRVQQNEAIWGESSARLDQSGVRHTFDATDLPSPCLVAACVTEVGSEGIKPLLMLSSSRAPFENRFFYDGGNRNFVYQVIDWLAKDEGRIMLPPKAPVDHRLSIPHGELPWWQWAIALLPALLISLMWWRRCRN